MTGAQLFAADEVLTVRRDSAPWLATLEGHRTFSSGLSSAAMCWTPRAIAEQNEAFLQIIPYAVLTRRAAMAWCYQRTGGDARLVQRLSCGVGGHIERCDDRGEFLPTVRAALRRELSEELRFETDASHIRGPIAWLHERTSAVGRVHLGLLFALEALPNGEPHLRPGQGMRALGFWPYARIHGDARFELWSRLALAALEEEER